MKKPAQDDFGLHCVIQRLAKDKAELMEALRDCLLIVDAIYENSATAVPILSNVQFTRLRQIESVLKRLTIESESWNKVRGNE